MATALFPDSAMGDDELISWDRVNELRDEVGAEDFDEIRDLFLAEVDDTLHRLADARPSANDFHALRGSALNLGMAALARHCRAAEHALKEGGDAPDMAAIAEVFRQSRARLADGP